MMLADIKNILKYPVVHSFEKVAMNIMENNISEDVGRSLLTDIQECFENIGIVANFEDDTSGCDSSTLCSVAKDASIGDHVELNCCSSQPSSENILCLQNSKQFLDNLEFNVSNKRGSYVKKNLEELEKCSLKELQILIEDLRQSVEKVSGELVQLLLDNDALQQESDARNIAIEQLLKLTVKVNESDLKPIQMSVILPDDDCDDI